MSSSTRKIKSLLSVKESFILKRKSNVRSQRDVTHSIDVFSNYGNNLYDNVSREFIMKASALFTNSAPAYAAASSIYQTNDMFKEIMEYDDGNKKGVVAPVKKVADKPPLKPKAKSSKIIMSAADEDEDSIDSTQKNKIKMLVISY